MLVLKYFDIIIIEIYIKYFNECVNNWNNCLVLEWWFVLYIKNCIFLICRMLEYICCDFRFVLLKFIFCFKILVYEYVLKVFFC